MVRLSDKCHVNDFQASLINFVTFDTCHGVDPFLSFVKNYLQIGKANEFNKKYHTNL
ncbi:hypothetical protein tinsulaeT_25670 [Thalassotalea insulae]|uniref:Uncharacterized protein n=1 Tax=Thalassotalea insulae TaxID=2056778 RepID=A0ABQ6GTJ2_9GAMM|nr:hypothetical protein tinsulaeT_25670 [Thalassotalea insulae]